MLLDLDHVANVSHISAKKNLNKKTTWPLERIIQALQNLTKWEFLALFRDLWRYFVLSQFRNFCLVRFWRAWKNLSNNHVGFLFRFFFGWVMAYISRMVQIYNHSPPLSSTIRRAKWERISHHCNNFLRIVLAQKMYLQNAIWCP